jgi:hypothetical protein
MFIFRIATPAQLTICIALTTLMPICNQAETFFGCTARLFTILVVLSRRGSFAFSVSA